MKWDLTWLREHVHGGAAIEVKFPPRCGMAGWHRSLKSLGTRAIASFVWLHATWLA